MKMCTFFLLISLLSACYPSPEPPVVLLSPKEEKLLGTWQEIRPKIAHYDGAGNFIDSVDISSVYTFQNDYTFTAENETWINASSGTWTFDTLENKIALDPLISGNPMAGQRDHLWAILTLDSAVLEVYHHYEFFTLSDTGNIILPRNFVKQ